MISAWLIGFFFWLYLQKYTHLQKIWVYFIYPFEYTNYYFEKNEYILNRNVLFLSKSTFWAKIFEKYTHFLKILEIYPFAICKFF